MRYAIPTPPLSHFHARTSQDPTDAVGHGSGDSVPPVPSADQAMDDATVDDEAVVCSLAATGGLTVCGGDSAGVPSAEEGLNLWEPNEQEAKTIVLDVPSFTQV